MCSTKLEFAHQFQIFQTKKVTDIMETITAAERIKQNKLRKIQILAEQKKKIRRKLALISAASVVFIFDDDIENSSSDGLLVKLFDSTRQTIID